MRLTLTIDIVRPVATTANSGGGTLFAKEGGGTVTKEGGTSIKKEG